MIPLNLDSRQQTLLANICEHMRRAVYDTMDRHYEHPGNVDWDYEARKLGEALLLIGADTKPQEWDVMYDKLHRTGSNF